MSVKAHRHVVHHRKHRHVTHHRKHRRHVLHHHRRKRRSARSKVGLAAPPVLAPVLERAQPGGWITGGNDHLPVCATVAVANCLLTATGVRATDAQILALHDVARGDRDGANLDDILDALLTHGLAGVRPRDIAPVAVARAGLLAVSWTAGWHAVAVPPGQPRWVSWGNLADPFGDPVEGWLISW